MSRLGKSPIIVPKGTEIKVVSGEAQIKGPKGQFTLKLPEGIQVKLEDSKATVERDEAIDMPRPTHGLYRAMLNNMIVGVSKGFERRLTLIGVGYRAAVQGQVVDLQLGYSHPTKVKIPSGVQVTVDKSTTIIINGIDKHVVGQFAAQIRSKRPPEPYKGKGIRYENEYVRKKAGKAAKGKTA